MSLSIPDLGGIFVLTVLAAIMIQPLNSFINYALPHLGDLSSLLIQLVVPMIFIVILTSLWSSSEPGR